MANEAKAEPKGFKACYMKAVVAQIKGDRKHGWGVDDSLETILALISEWSGTEVADIKKETPDFVEYLRKLINPSAHRQSLEGDKGLLDETIGRKKAQAIAWDAYKDV